MTGEPHDDVPSIEVMLWELDLPVYAARDEFVELHRNFAASLQPALDLLMSIEGCRSGEQAFVVPALLVRAVNDLMAAFHLLTHGYLNQAYNAMRMAYEACDLIELVGQDAEQAALWVNSPRPWRDFSSARVRERLGNDPYDEIYSQLCAYSHPRFEGANLTGYRSRPAEDPDGTWTHVLRVGPFLVDDHPAVGFAAGLLGSALGLVVLRTSHLVTAGSVQEVDWKAAMALSMERQHAYMKTVVSILAARGVEDAEPLAEQYPGWQAVGGRGADPNGAAR